MGASIEWVSGIVRAGPNYEKFGDPFEFTCYVIKNVDKCEIKGGCGKLSISDARKIQELLVENEVTEMKWERKKIKKGV